MKAGRNDACPCGSGKKYKKCCLANDREASSRQTAVTALLPSHVDLPRSDPVLTQPHPKPVAPTASARTPQTPSHPLPLDPVTERGESCWREFESANDEGRIAVFKKTLEDAEVMTDDLAFEMLSILRGDAMKSTARTRFAECVDALRERRPELFDKSAQYYLSWCLLDALAESRPDAVPSLARELAPAAGRDIDIFNRAMDCAGISRPIWTFSLRPCVPPGLSRKPPVMSFRRAFLSSPQRGAITRSSIISNTRPLPTRPMRFCSNACGSLSRIRARTIFESLSAI